VWCAPLRHVSVAKTDVQWWHATVWRGVCRRLRPRRRVGCGDGRRRTCGPPSRCSGRPREDTGNSGAMCHGHGCPFGQPLPLLTQRSDLPPQWCCRKAREGRTAQVRHTAFGSRRSECSRPPVSRAWATRGREIAGFMPLPRSAQLFCTIFVAGIACGARVFSYYKFDMWYIVCYSREYQKRQCPSKCSEHSLGRM
jgi:hypothetical protein